jgi:SAM-dependent methyltransferase
MSVLQKGRKSDNIRTSSRVTRENPGSYDRTTQGSEGRDETLVFNDPNLSEAIHDSARRYKVSSAIHAEDFIFHFLLNASKDKAQGAQLYFESGKSSAEQASAIYKEHAARPPRRVLDFASGYGCVTRHLPGVLPGSKVFACDVLESCVTFVSQCLEFRALQSAKIPEELVINKRFDLIIVLSLFSHLPERTFSRWLRQIARLAAPGGIVLFTTHGRMSAQQFGNPPLTADGFWHDPRKEHPNLDASNYGLSICSRKYCEVCIEEIKDVKLVDYREGFWWGHQDVYVLRKQGRAETASQLVSKLFTALGCRVR